MQVTKMWVHLSDSYVAREILKEAREEGLKWGEKEQGNTLKLYM